MKILTEIKKWFIKKPEPQKEIIFNEPENNDTPVQKNISIAELQMKKIPFAICQYCGKHFLIDQKKIFPIKVPLLYKEETITGKGYKCPFCKADNVIG